MLSLHHRLLLELEFLELHLNRRVVDVLPQVIERLLQPLYAFNNVGDGLPRVLTWPTTSLAKGRAVASAFFHACANIFDFGGLDLLERLLLLRRWLLGLAGL